MWLFCFFLHFHNCSDNGSRDVAVNRWPLTCEGRPFEVLKAVN